MVTVRFSEFEACVTTIITKVKEAIGRQDSYILTDSQGNEIIHSEGTRGIINMLDVIVIAIRNALQRVCFDYQMSQHVT